MGTTYFNLTQAEIGNTTTWGLTDNQNWSTLDSALYAANGGLTTGVNSESSASSITLTNPLASTQEIGFSASGQSLTLPAMNATFSPVVGGVLAITNTGSYPFPVLAQDGTTVVYGSGALAGTITGGASYTNGVYADVPLTGGAGSGARATITVSGGVVSGVVLTSEGIGFAVGNSLTTANTNIGGTGSGFAFVLTAVTGVPVGATLKVTVTSISSANGAFITALQGNLYSTNNLLDVGDTATALGNLGGVTSASAVTAALNAVYPIGSIYSNASVATNPATLLGVGTWAALGAGRMLIGVGTGTDINGATLTVAAGATGGEYQHTQTVNELVSHGHTDAGHTHPNGSVVSNSAPAGGTGQLFSPTNTGTGTANIQNTGGGQPFNVTNPYLAVYLWTRTA